MSKDLVSQMGQFDEIISIIDNARTRALKAVNAELIQMYWSVGEYLSALCYLGQNRRTKAKKILLTIVESNSHHREAASELVQAISEIKTHRH